MKTRIGAMRHRVTIQKATRTKGAGGEGSDAWATVATVAAEVTPATAGDVLRGEQREFPVTHRVRIRYRADIGAADHRIVFDGRTMRIAEPLNPDGRKRFLLMMATTELPT